MKKAALAGAAAVAMLALTGVLPSPAAPTPLASASTGTDVKVASFNIQSVSLDQTNGNRQPWKERRGKVIAELMSEHPDVIGVQEANPSYSYPTRLVDGPTQYFDLRNGLNKAGGNYQLTNTVPYNCVNARSNYKCVYQYRGASWGDRILYNRDTIDLVRSGSTLYSVQGAGVDKRYIAWAVLSVKATGHTFLFVGTHPRGDASQRGAQLNQLVSRINALKQGRPVVAVGDFNTQKFDPFAATLLPKMRNNGYGDVLNQEYAVNPVRQPRAQSTVDAWINSYNHLNRAVDQWSYSQRRDKTGNMIDYVFATNSLPVRRFRLVLDYDASTLQVNGVFPSDHNMITATLTMP